MYRNLCHKLSESLDIDLDKTFNKLSCHVKSLVLLRNGFIFSRQGFLPTKKIITFITLYVRILSLPNSHWVREIFLRILQQTLIL